MPTPMYLLQSNAASWCIDTFNEQHLMDPRERGLRALEECMEAVQAVGLQPGDINAIRDQVFGKPVAEAVSKEIGDAIFTMLLFAECNKVDACAATEAVINSAWDRQAHIRQRYLLKFRNEAIDVKG